VFSLAKFLDYQGLSHVLEGLWARVQQAISNIPLIPGPPGTPGQKGDKGDKGDTGNTGATGAQGPSGSITFTPVNSGALAGVQNADQLCERLNAIFAGQHTITGIDVTYN